MTEVDPRNVCPMRMLLILKWSHALDGSWTIKGRIVMQGFKIFHLLDRHPEKKPGTLSRTARFLLF
eukprot:6612819-Prorocentrum_lima.AAC.1